MFDFVLGGVLEASWSYLGRFLRGQDAPRTSQDGAKMGQDGAKTAQDGAKTGQGGAKTPQNGAKTLQDGAETVQERQITKTLKNLRITRFLKGSWSYLGKVLGGQDAPKTVQDGGRAKRASERSERSARSAGMQCQADRGDAIE